MKECLQVIPFGVGHLVSAMDYFTTVGLAVGLPLACIGSAGILVFHYLTPRDVTSRAKSLLTPYLAGKIEQGRWRSVINVALLAVGFVAEFSQFSSFAFLDSLDYPPGSPNQAFKFLSFNFVFPATTSVFWIASATYSIFLLNYFTNVILLCVLFVLACVLFAALPVYVLWLGVRAAMWLLWHATCCCTKTCEACFRCIVYNDPLSGSLVKTIKWLSSAFLEAAFGGEAVSGKLLENVGWEVLLGLLLLPVMRLCFQMLGCDYDPSSGQAVLSIQPDLVCWTRVHWRLVAMDIFFLPLTYLSALYYTVIYQWKRSAHVRLKPRFEIFFLASKLLLVACKVLIPNDFENLIVLTVTLSIILAANLLVHPCVNPDHLGRRVNSVRTAVLGGALLSCFLSLSVLAQGESRSKNVLPVVLYYLLILPVALGLYKLHSRLHIQRRRAEDTDILKYYFHPKNLDMEPEGIRSRYVGALFNYLKTFPPETRPPVGTILNVWESPEEWFKTDADRELNTSLDRAIQRDQSYESAVTKILVLGQRPREVEKFFYHFQKDVGQGFAPGDRQRYVEVVHAHVLSSMKRLLRDRGPIEVADSLWEVRQQVLLLKADTYLDAKIGYLIRALWADAGVRKAHRKLQEADELDEDDFGYFLDEVNVITEEGYLPSDEDILRVFFKSRAGIVDVEANLDGSLFRFFYVWQVNERKKWIHCFEFIDAMVFVANISQYDQVEDEDSKTNRVVESLHLFRELSNSRWLRETPKVLMLSGRSQFIQKRFTRPLSKYFPEYRGPEEVEPSLEFIKKTFEDQDTCNRGNLYTHVVDFDTHVDSRESIKRKVFNSFKDIIFKRSVAHFL